jgi:hypothetical protein
MAGFDAPAIAASSAGVALRVMLFAACGGSFGFDRPRATSLAARRLAEFDREFRCGALH